MQTFTMTDQHIKLMRRMCVGYNEDCEFGAPEIDPKRPYGNSDVYTDIGEIIDISPLAGDADDPEFTEEQKGKMMILHKQMAIALQVVLSTQSFERGRYVCSDYSNDWKLEEALSSPRS